MLWFAWKFVPLWYQQQRRIIFIRKGVVVICLKIRTFVVSATTNIITIILIFQLWFAWKFVPLWYQQQRAGGRSHQNIRCDLLENSYLCGISNNPVSNKDEAVWLWFAWKFVPLWYQQQQSFLLIKGYQCCDLLENSYLCGISNNHELLHPWGH